MQLKSRLVILLSVLLFSIGGCGALDGDGASPAADNEFRAAVPTASAMSVDVPSNDGSGLALGDPAPLYQLTHGVSGSVNAHVGVLLAYLRIITLFPPSERGDTFRVWGPSEPQGLEDTSYRFRVDKLGDTRYSFTLDGRPKGSTSDDAFLPLITGEVTPGADEKGLTSAGTLSMLYDNHKEVSLTECRAGTINVTWDGSKGARDVEVQWVDFVDCQQEPVPNSTYNYHEESDHSGTFQFISEANIHGAAENKPEKETVTINSRWATDGAGRSDVVLSGTEISADLMSAGLSESEVKASQCWSDLFALTYSDTDPDELEALVYENLGAETDCPFKEAAFPQN